MSKAIDDIKSDHQKELVANTLLEDESNSKGNEFRKNWIMNTMAKKNEDDPDNKFVKKEYNFD